jgi:hypothetical protein
MRHIERLARDVVLWNRWADLREIFEACLGYRFEPGRQRDQLRLTERCAKERNAEGDSEHLRRRHLNVWIASRSAEAGAAKDEVITIQQVS